MGVLVLPVACRVLVDACRRLGVDTAALLERAGFAGVRLDDPDVRLPSELNDALWREAQAITGDPCLGLHVGEGTPYGAYRVLDYLLATGATLGEGLRRVAGYFPIIDPRGALTFEESGDVVRVAFRSAHGRPPPPAAQEYSLAIVLTRVRHVMGMPVTPAGVRFAFERPSNAGEHLRFFGVEPCYGAAAASLALPRALCDVAAPSADPRLFAALDEHATRLLDRVRAPVDVAAQVRAVVADSLPDGEPSLEAIARRVGVSRRSLQRRLEDAGTSFGQLVDAVRQERAQAFLAANDVSIAEVSWLVGFAEQSAFTRAFRRWTGQAPAAWRRQRRREPAIAGASPSRTSGS